LVFTLVLFVGALLYYKLEHATDTVAESILEQLALLICATCRRH